MGAAVRTSIVKRMGPDDALTYVLEPEGCHAARSLLKNVIELPDSPSGKHWVSQCQIHGEPCNGYRIAQIKFIYGIVHEVRRLNATGGAGPMWWMIQDDDTYVHVPYLMRAIDGFDKKH